MTDYAKMTPDELLENADRGMPESPNAIHSLRVAEIKLAIRANEISGRLLDSNKATREVAEKQLAASQKANELAEALLESNRTASDQSERMQS
jgi:hypothetical protein